MRKVSLAVLLALLFPMATLRAQDVQEPERMGFEQLFEVAHRMIEEDSTDLQQKEFAEFLLEFFGNKEEQYKHVLFPILFVDYDIDTGYYMRSIEEAVFSPDRLDYNNCVFRMKQLSVNLMLVEIIINDTDIGYDYIFKYNNKQWWLSDKINISI